MSEVRSQLRDALKARLNCATADEAWRELHAAGVIGLRVPSVLGGLELDVADAATVFEVLGELCLPTSYLETSVIAPGLLLRMRSDTADGLLRRVVDGARIAVAGCEPEPLGELRAESGQGQWRLRGKTPLVVDAMDADALLVCATRSDRTPLWFAVNTSAAGLTQRKVPTLDGRIAADLTFDGVAADALSGDAAAATQVVVDEALACICTEAAAIMSRLVSDTTAYVKQREQFGQALSTFQVVQHRLVDMHIHARRARAIARRAVESLQDEPSVRQRAISAAKVTICRAGRFVGQNAVQLHGGMGMTADLAVGRCFKRLTVIEAELGGADYHLRRFQRLRDSAP